MKTDWDAPDDPFDVYDEQTFDPESQCVMHAGVCLPRCRPMSPSRSKTARPEQAEVLIAGHLNDLLVKLPDIFPRITSRLCPQTDDRAGYLRRCRIYGDEIDDDDDED
jgi:hypothetical protein